MKYENIFYLTHDISQDMEFLFVEIGANTWRGYILSKFSGENATSYVGHILTETNDDIINKVRMYMRMTRMVVNTNEPLHYICWDSPIRNLHNMRTIAKYWTEINAYSIKYKCNFDESYKRLQKKGVLN